MDQEGMNYYKSLVSDNEVIEALIKESKAREGDLEKPRIRPNLNFLQRTVSNMVSSNKRISTKQEQFIAKEKEKNVDYRPRRVPVRKKLPIQLIQEILSSKINFVKSSEETESAERKTTEIRKKSKENRRSKTPFQLMREILTKQVRTKDEEVNGFDRKTDPCSSSDTSEELCSSKRLLKNEEVVEDIKFTKRKRRKGSKNTADAAVIDISDSSSDSSVCEVTTDVIKISDSDTDCDDIKKCVKNREK